MDNTFRFRDHVSKCLQRAYFSLKMLYPHRKFLTSELKLSLSNSLVLSQLLHCSQVFSPCLDAVTMRKIQTLQNSCLRFSYGVRKYQHISDKLVTSGWLNMENRFRFHRLCLYHKIIVSELPSYLHDKIRYRTDIHNINIRRRHLLSLPKYRLSLFRRSFAYRICIEYNALPETLKVMTTGAFRINVFRLLRLSQQHSRTNV